MASLTAQELNPNYGNGRHTIAQSDAVMLAQFDLDRRIRETFSSPSYRPPVLPAVAIDLMRVASNPDVTVPTVVGMLEKDPVLASGVLKLCKSPLHSARIEVRSLKEAVVRLGLKLVRDVALEVSMNARVFRADAYGELMADLSDHSRATAHVARIVCRYATWDAEYAFLCGLIHDIGIVTSLLVLNDLPRNIERPPMDVLVPSIVQEHEERAEIVAKAWGMPDEVVWVIGHHHHIRVGTEVHPMSAIIAVADYVATRLGHGPFRNAAAENCGRDLKPGQGCDETPLAQLKLAAETLALNKNAMDLIMRDAQKTLASHG
jgi:HD-like signal output (HDOD) protein